MLSCFQASQLLSQSLDRPLSWRERLSLKLHLIICEVCTRFAKQLKFMRDAVRQLIIATETDEDTKMPQIVHDKITKILNKH